MLELLKEVRSVFRDLEASARTADLILGCSPEKIVELSSRVGATIGRLEGLAAAETMVDGQYELTVVFTRDLHDDLPVIADKAALAVLSRDDALVMQLRDELQEACDGGLAGCFVVIGPPRYHDVDEGPPDLTRTDCYEGTVIPNADYETALKVVRTVRNLCLGPLFFDAEGSITLSYAHACLCRLAAACEGKTPDPERDGPGDLTACECDNTHEQNDTVCRWCWSHGRRRWNDPDVSETHDVGGDAGGA